MPRSIDSVLSLQPESGETYQVRIRAEYFEGQIDTKQFRVMQPQYQPLSANPLVLEPERQRYVFISKFGAVVFWNCSPEIIAEFLRAVESLPSAVRRIEDVADEMVVNV